LYLEINEKNTSSEKIQENNYIIANNSNNNSEKKILSYGEFLSKNKNATKKDRCKAIVDFYIKIFNQK
jgi:hypothetical protein